MPSYINQVNVSFVKKNLGLFSGCQPRWNQGPPVGLPTRGPMADISILGGASWFRPNQRSPIALLASPPLQCISEKNLIVITWRDIKRPVKSPEVRNLSQIGRVGVIDKAQDFNWSLQTVK